MIINFLQDLFSTFQVYDMNIIAEKAGCPGGFCIGAGGGSSHHVGVNSEVSIAKCKKLTILFPHRM